VSPQRGPKLPYIVVAGVTPCPPGWLVQSAKINGATFAPETPRIYEAFLDILSERPSFETIVINAPVGYPGTPELGPRTCDVEARLIVGQRGAAIHNAPSRAVLNGDVKWADGGVDAVTATLLPRYREVAIEMSPFRQRHIYEGNPELSFFQLNQDTSMRRSKKTQPGQDERRGVLETHIPGVEEILDANIEGVLEKHIVAVVDGPACLRSCRKENTD
jgi:predicted RNase H-like nuclease